ncbi:ABC transporter permease [Chitinophaga japonensis]|uniref:Putative ABC transport system permease protein n=1 Tax=Chitinophaga japonensis TaxID=104662 RepID=A0A562SMN8_CHIJA|nr:ABC transporter permease [Chitinophaga japonensis]TWI82433.1 putative ABC transport system permease protein [Chitinophaga japonensis]
MFGNYFKIAFRNLRRNKIYSLINIAGLGLGLACAMLIILYVKDEVSFDRFHKNGNNIYRIVSKVDEEGHRRQNSNTGYLQGPRFAQHVSGIRDFVRIESSTVNIKTGADVSTQDALRVDHSFFSMFSFPLLGGNAQTCLREPHTVVLSEDAARKQFGTTDAVGKVLMIKEDSTFAPFRVTAVTKRCPQNSSIQFEMLLPFSASDEAMSTNENWYSYFLNTFVTLEPGQDPLRVGEQMQRFYLADAREAFNILVERYGDHGASMGTYFLQPFADMHTNTALPATNGLSHASNPVYSYILSAIALFVLLIACINFVNLTVARSVKRAKEIGIRKVVGSDRRQLVLQFLGESFLLCFIAFSLALLIVQLILPSFNTLANKALSLSYLLDARLIGGYILLFLFTGFLAGSYPALVLSGYRPVETLYHRFNIAGKNYLQQSLVVLQFALASFLIIATFIIYAQFNYLTRTDLGYDDRNMVAVNKYDIQHPEAAAFRAELLKNPGIRSVAVKDGGYSFTGARLANDSAISFNYVTIDEAFFPTFRIPVVQGRNFSAAYPSDAAHSVLVNEAFVKQAGWKQPLGQIVNFFYNNNEIYRVVGVVKDYHYASLTQKIGPQLFTMKESNPYGTFYIKIKPGTEAATLQYIQRTFRQFFPLSPYSYVFKDEANRQSYAAEAKWKQILLLSAVLTIFISCIGLFGLSVLATERRTKEIGIRKVLGASVNSVVAILSKDFLKLVAIALVLAVPLAWMAAGKWLENYPYRITPGWQLFAIAGVLVIAVALATISFQTLRAALANPAKSLRTE